MKVKKMANIEFGGYGTLANGKTVHFPTYQNPSKEIIYELTRYTTDYAEGVISVSIKPEPEYGIYDLVIRYENGRYFPLLGKYLDDGDADVKNWIDSTETGRQVAIGGYFYPIELTTTDIKVVANLLLAFTQDLNLVDKLMK